MNNHHSPDPMDRAREFWGTIVLHRWGILLTTVVLAAMAVVVIALLPDVYVASTTVLFDPQQLPEKYVAQTVISDPAQRLNTLTQEVLNPGRLQQISQDLHLAGDRNVSQQEVIEQMRKAITIDMKPNSEHEISAFVITYTGADPQTVANVANRLAQSFIDWDLANRAQQATSTTEFMASQLQDAKQLMDSEEEKIRNYKVQYAGELPERLQSNLQALSILRVALQANSDALDRLEQEKTLLSAVPEGARSVTGAGSERDRLEAEQRTLESELATLRSQYTEQYPDVVTTREKLDLVTKQLQGMAATSSTSTAAVRLQIIARETARLQEEQKNLMHRIEKYQALVDAAPIRGQEFDSLSRNYTSARQQYETLLDRKFHAEMAMELVRQQNSSRFTVDPAQVPRRPIKPNRVLLLAMTLPFCCLVPAGISVASAEMRGTINSERTLRALLPDTTRVVGKIPMIQTPSGIRRQRRWAMLSVLGALICCATAAGFLWGHRAAQMRRNLAHPGPTAELIFR